MKPGLYVMAWIPLWLACVSTLTQAQPQSQPQPISEALEPIHNAYANGDFEEVLLRIEAYQKRYPRHGLSDSIFIAKHLAVVYASNPQTREKGRYFMFRMLEMNASADLVDMFISQELDEIFEKVRKEFFVRQNRAQPGKSHAAPVVKTESPKKEAEANPKVATRTERAPWTPQPHASEVAPKRSTSTWIWVIGGVAVAASAATAYYLTQETPAEGKNIPLD